MVSEVYAKRAIALVDDYFIPMGKLTLSEHAIPQKQIDARIMAKWILSEKCDTVNIREMKRQRVLHTKSAERYDAAVSFLVSCGWLGNAGQRNGYVGRKQKTYNMNTAVFEAETSDA